MTQKLLIIPLVIVSLLVPLRQRHAAALSPRQVSLNAISWAARRWDVSYWWLYRVARCESSFNPNAWNPSGASGLFQFMPGTYYAYAARIGEWRSLWNPYASANVAAYMASRGQQDQWACN